MVLTNDVYLPSIEELTVPQEITLSTPWLKAVAAYMHVNCENEIKEFMLLRREYEDPRRTIKEGAKVTACGVDFLRNLKKTCLDGITKYADCIDKSHEKLYITECRTEQYHLDKCVEEKLNIIRPPVGYFSKIHVHQSDTPPPSPYKHRDYKSEAAKMMDELPEDFHLRKDHRKFNDFNYTYFDQ